MIGDLADRDVLDGVGRLLEEERRLAVRIRAALDRVRRVVAADAVDAADLEHLGLADDRDHDHRHREDRPGCGLRCGRRRVGKARRGHRGCGRQHGAPSGLCHGFCPLRCFLGGLMRAVLADSRYPVCQQRARHDRFHGRRHLAGRPVGPSMELA
jgi:hypothetical protein